MDVAVRCAGSPEAGWTCDVTVRERGRDLTTHRVRVASSDLERLAPGSADPTALVAASFAFLLEREPPGSILGAFNLMDIGRYFSEYERQIRNRSGA